VVKPAARRQVVDHLRRELGFSESRACGLIRMSRSSYRYTSRRPADDEVRKRLRALAAKRPRWGYRRLRILLQREGIEMNHKRLYRLYTEEGLKVRRKRRKRIAGLPRNPVPRPDRPNRRWSLDFMSDTLLDGRCFRTLNVVDDFTRECLAIEVDTSIPGRRVVRVLERLVAERGEPESIVLDNGPELTSRAVDAWAYQHGIRLDFIRPGKPVENAYVESFNGKFRDECLNEHWFTGLADARFTIECWRRDYNVNRPHSSLGNVTPVEFARRTARLQPAPPASARQLESATISAEVPL